MYGKGWDNSEMAVPLNKKAPKHGPNGWWFHGKIDEPPEEGQIAQLPAGGTWHTQVSCDKHFTTWGNPNERYGEVHAACDEVAMLHSGDGNPYDGKAVQKDIKGCALAIAYESDPHKVDSDSMVIFSVQYQCPWFKEVEFEIPADLPPCPPGGCHCSWNWSHSPKGGGSEHFMTLFKCNIKGATGTRALTTKPKVANKCPWDRNNCTVGAKTPFIFNQAEGNNFFQDFIDPPYYNWEYGFANGAQKDLFERDASVLNTAWAPDGRNTYDGDHPAPTPAANRFVPPVQDGVTIVTPNWKTGPKTYPPGEDPSDPANAAQPAQTSVSLIPFTTEAAPTPSPVAAKPVSDAGATTDAASPTPTNVVLAASPSPSESTTTGSGEAVTTTADGASTTTGSGEAATPTASGSGEAATPTASGSGEAVPTTTGSGTAAPSGEAVTGSASDSGTAAPTGSASDSGTAAATGSASDSGSAAPTTTGSGTAAPSGSAATPSVSDSGTAAPTATPSGSGTAAPSGSASGSGTPVVPTTAASASGSDGVAPTGNAASATNSGSTTTTASPAPAGSPSARPPPRCRPKKNGKRRASF
ncbi:hypothetical protein VHUM_03271 [Vanrija humicola]|uniref:Uncharacterized protein n=1 Tax=Vanrija humicola TaxID=5417 RepID=A0A7D8YXQ8_VANHU|nr:hypothetical protein VHUM_03271 [Vanrija humicola]